MTKEDYEKAYKRGCEYLLKIAQSPIFEIVEDSYEYYYGLVLIEYADDNHEQELSHTCINLEDFVQLYYVSYFYAQQNCRIGCLQGDDADYVFHGYNQAVKAIAKDSRNHMISENNIEEIIERAIYNKTIEILDSDVMESGEDNYIPFMSKFNGEKLIFLLDDPEITTIVRYSIHECENPVYYLEEFYSGRAGVDILNDNRVYKTLSEVEKAFKSANPESDFWRDQITIMVADEKEINERERRETRIFDSHGADSELNERTGSNCEIIRKLTEEEADPEVGPMFHIKFEDGFETDAFEDELIRKDVSYD